GALLHAPCGDGDAVRLAELRSLRGARSARALAPVADEGLAASELVRDLGERCVNSLELTATIGDVDGVDAAVDASAVSPLFCGFHGVNSSQFDEVTGARARRPMTMEFPALLEAQLGPMRKKRGRLGRRAMPRGRVAHRSTDCCELFIDVPPV